MNRNFAIAALAIFASIACGTPANAGDLEEGIVQYRLENFEEALALLEKSRAQQRQSSVAAFYLGMARKQGGDLSGAIKDLTDAATLKPPVLDAYLELADAHHVAGDDKKALEWANRSETAGVRPGQSAFIKGIILAGQGKGEDAVKAFEKAKKLDAALAQPADLQIAMVMAGSRKLTRARDALRAVVAADPNSEIASYAKEYEQSFTRIIEDYRTWHATLGIGYLYDDNAISNPSNAGARAQIGDPTGQRDFATLGTLRLDYSPMLSGDLVFNAQYLLQSTTYANANTDAANPSTIINSLTLNPGYSLGGSVLSLPVNYSHVLLREQKYQQMIGARPTWSWLLAPQHILQGGVSYTRRDMLQDPLAPEEDRDANLWGASLGHVFSYGNRGGMAAVRYEFTFDATKGSNWENRGHRVSLNGVVPLTDDLKLNLSGEVASLDYLKPNMLIGNGVKRDDTTWFGTVGLSYSLNRHATLNAQYSHTTAQSNIPVYGYNRNTFSTGLEFSF